VDKQAIAEPGHTRRRRGAALRRDVLDATIAELVEQGVDGFTVANTAQRAGVNITSIYRRWKTRENLVVDALLDRTATALPIPDTGSVRTDLELFAQLLAGYLGSPMGRALVKMATLVVDDPHLDQARSEFLAARAAAAGAIFERAIARGELDPHIDRQVALETLVAPLYFRVLVTGEPLGGDLPGRLVDTVLQGVARSR
jgi:AcrR family transcriptional regulator